MSAVALVGREDEISQLDRRLGEVDEAGGVLLLRGGVGIGKTSLLMAAVEAAKSRGYRVLSATGIESEANLPYAGLYQLLRPVMPVR